MFFAIRGNWGTHYDGTLPKFPEMGFWPKDFLIGFFPQLVFRVVFTVISGPLSGSNATAFLHRRKAVPQTAS